MTSSPPLEDLPLEDLPLEDLPLEDLPLEDLPLEEEDPATGEAVRWGGGVLTSGWARRAGAVSVRSKGSRGRRCGCHTILYLTGTHSCAGPLGLVC